MPPTTRRFLVAVLPHPLACAAVAGAYYSFRDRLPHPMASHIGPGNKADGFDDPGSFLTVSLVAFLAVGVVFAFLTWLTRSAPGQQRGVAVAGGGVGVALGWIVVGILRANAQVGAGGDAADVTLPIWQAGLGFAAGVVYGVLGWLVTGRDKAPAPATERAPAEAARLPLGESENASWTRVVGARAQLGVTAIMLVTGAFVAVVGGWTGGLVCLAFGVPLVLLCRVRVSADRRGITVTPAVLPWPRLNVPLERIEEAGHRSVDALRDLGGWGYRAHPGISGIVLRSGDALSARLTTGSEFVVTVDDAATAAALLNTLADRERSNGNGVRG
ncbi:hypothetical protein [Streptomyces hesseae]|uniref:DUF1648 domain-containing protein n=1 Tax=Streptomyces hesseae TaxID=3075519 RepID=A0ABU2SIB8_9ACTN|nr:hypothetical protein [Streptomyces sp. DSM 40473]MDT0448721.1 hypothetical protein [Streptomyces sp. DSM 40473]